MWIADLPDGRRAKITAGQGVAVMAAQITRLAQECPELVAPILFHRLIDDVEVLAETFFEGVTLEEAHRDGTQPPERIRSAFSFACSALRGTESVSDPAARELEWRQWVAALLLPEWWSAPERACLEHSILPRLFTRLSTGACTTRWTNGDFLSTNLLVGDTGEPRLVDFEFATRTHFFIEDAARFYALSPAAAREPELFVSDLPRPGLVWHLYFWLRQVQLEAQTNTTEYWERLRPLRLGVIRHLAETVLEVDCADWSVPAPVVYHRLEEATWFPINEARIRLSGWCHVPSAEVRRLIVFFGDQCVATARPAERSDVQQHFPAETTARKSGFVLHTDVVRSDARLIVSAETTDGSWLPFDSVSASELALGAPAWDDYPAWAAGHDPDPPKPATMPSGPLFSVLLPVFNPPVSFLHSCLGSVLAQHYGQWELCVVDDGSSQPDVAPCLESYAQIEPRVRVKHRTSNGGISQATNDALAMARGEFVVLLDHDDLLRPHALLEIVRHLAANPETDVVYSDEDKITADGRRLTPLFKPAYSPEFCLRVMYIGHALVVRTTVARTAGGFDSRYDGIQDYEFFLRAAGVARVVGHISSILYHWRQSPTSSALHGNAKGDMDTKHAAAVREHLARLGRTELVSARGGHRLHLSSRENRAGEIFRPAPGEGPLDVLRRAASASGSDVAILLSEEPAQSNPQWQHELSALARRPDSGLVAPLLLSAENRVLESGWTIWQRGATPIMRGYDPSGDGYNGTLSGSREVSAVSPRCVAIRCDLLRFAPPPTGGDWWDYCLQLSQKGVRHRVCSEAQLRVEQSIHDNSDRVSRLFDVAADPYYPRFLEAESAAYWLTPRETPSRLRSHLDSGIREPRISGCIIIRGWCFGPGEAIDAVRLMSSDRTLDGVVGLPRPDVKAALPEAPDDNTGFEIRGTLPPGKQVLRIEARTADGTWHLLLEKSITVKRRWLPLWLGGGDWTDLMFFQMPAHMAHPPRPVRPENYPPRRAIDLLPRLAIVTPSFQQARFLPETMRSVLGQRDVSVDYVVRDGGSTDGSLEVIRQVAAEHPASPNADGPASAGTPPHSRLAAWASERDDGQADAIARGFAHTSGAPEDIMAWINSDDLYLPGALSFVARYFAAHPDVDVIYGNRIVVDEQSREIARWFLPPHDDAVLRLNDFVPQETVFWRRRVWDRVGGLDRSFKFAMDWDLLLRFSAAGARIVRVPYFLACFRVHPAQKTSSSMHDIGRREIDLLRARASGMDIPVVTLEQNPLLLRYLRRSAFLEFLWRLRNRS
jgi:glycosyltransferase involved in cell wall biosynthesis